jgi:DNA processing protein
MKLAEELSKLSITIVSGMAEGIDAAAHWGALEGSGKTIAVLGCGLDVVYPARNRKLYERITEEGSVVTEFPLGTQPLPTNFPVRNRIISGLSRGVVVVEGSEKSGSLHTADFALTQGREVFAVPGSINSSLSRTPHKLLKSGARLVENVSDILEEFGLEENKQEKQFSLFDKSPRDLLEQLPPGEKGILSLIGHEPLEIDEIIRQSGLKTSEVNSILVTLELKKLIAQDSGKRYYRLL